MNSSPKNEIDSFRTFFDGLGNAYPYAADVKLTPEVITNVNCYWFESPHAERNRIIVYLHGGSYAAGSLASHKNLTSHLAEFLNIPVLFVEYSLAPENPYPKGVLNALAVYLELAARYPSSKLILMGDSAGGGLSVSLLGEIQKKEVRQPAALVMISPWIDLRCENESYRTNAKKDHILSQAVLKNFASQYVTNVNANPADIILKSPPPAWIAVGEDEVLLDDSRKFYTSIKERQPHSSLKIFKEVAHVWILSDITSEKAIDTLTGIRSFLESI
jgi:acetyl esterase/lipase